MLKVYRFQKGGVKAGSLNDLGNSIKCWADCINPTDKELKNISEKTKIPLAELREVMDEEERPKVFELEDYSVIIIRAPWISNDEIKTTPISIFISKSKFNVITIALKEIDSLKKIRQLVEAKKIDLHDRGLGFFTFRFLDEIFNTYFKILDRLEERIGEIEDLVVEKHDQITVQDIFKVKKTLIFFHKALTANREVIGAIEKEYVTNIDKKNLKSFRVFYRAINWIFIQAIEGSFLYNKQTNMGSQCFWLSSQ